MSVKGRLPNKVLIGLADYQIIVDGDIGAESPGNAGMCHTSTKKIWINSNQQPACMAQTLWHEILHAASYEYSVHYVDNPDEEYLVDAYSLALCQVFRDNPEIVQWTRFAVS